MAPAVHLLFRVARRWLPTVVALAIPSGALGQTLYKQPSFHEAVVFSGLASPITMRFLPDGSVLVAEKSGLIKKYDSLTDTTPTVVADLRTKVHNFWDRGLLGLAIDPNFASNPYIYVLYTHDAAIGATPPRWGPGDGTSDPCPSPPGATTDGCVVSGHLSRLHAVGSDWTASEQVLIQEWCQQFPSHSVGALGFGADGKLYVSGGEGASFTSSDWGQWGGSGGSPTPKNPCGDPPVPIGGNQTPPGAEGGALRSQSPRRTSGEPRVLNGSILRVDPATGEALPDNPLFGSSDLKERRIIGYGFRNPFRMIVKPGTNEVFVADVGSSNWEEINRIPDLTVARNYGWPCFEGPDTGFQGFTICPPQAQTTPPLYNYHHSASVVPADGCLTGSSSIAGMAFHTGSGNYPPAYNGALFFSDYSRKCIWVMYPDGFGTPDPNTRAAFAASAQGPVDLQIGPDGSLYYADFDGGKIWRVDYGPVAVASGNPTTGSIPLEVNFSSAGSAPAQTGDTITFAWDLDGDGQYDDSTAANPSWTYTASGAYTVRLKVTDNHGAFNISSPVAINAGNTPPTATILTPASTLTWKVGDPIGFSGSANDPEQGPLPASALSWQIIIHHCPTTCHTHVYQTFAGVSGGSFPAPDHEYYSYLEIALTATDAGGLTHTASVSIQPQTVDLSFATVPSGLQLLVGTSSSTAPFTRTLIHGSQTLISAFSQGNYQFSSWSDGGAASHTVTATAPATYTATFTIGGGGGLPAPWVDLDIGAVGAAGSASYSGGSFTVAGAGSDIWNNADQFHYVYQPLSGDATIIARVVSQEDTDAWAKAGVMIRETLSANSRNAMMATTPSNGLAFQRRTVTGGSASHTAGPLVAAPYWVKLVRTGNTVSGYSSPDGITWSLVGSDTVTMSAAVYVGLPVTGHAENTLCTVVFDNVSVTGGPGNAFPTATIISPANGATFTAPATIVIDATASDTDGTISKVDFYRNGILLGTDATSPYSYTWSSVGAGSYSLTAVATDNQNGTGTSPPVGVTVNPGANNPPFVSISSPANGATFTAPATIVINATASDTDGTVTKVDFYQSTVLLGTDTTSPYSYTWPSVGQGSYSLTAVATDNLNATTTSTPVNVTVTASGGSLPPPWVEQDIGAVGAAGSATYAGGVYTVKGSGTDIGGTSDLFHYVHQPLSGDGTIIARVVSVQNTHAWAKAGVMIRETLAANSRNALMDLTPGNGLSFQRRTATGGTTTKTTGGPAAAPYWVKLVRTGNSFSGYVSASGTSWTLVKTVTITMSTAAYAGLAVTSHKNLTLCTGVFDNVSVAGPAPNNPPSATIISPANGATFTAPATIVINATASDTDGTVTKVDFYRNGILLGTDATSPYSYTWSSVGAGSYSLTAVATDNQNGTGTSPPVGVTVNPGANNPPFVSISSPANGATFTAPATIVINATASDTDGTVTKVDFYRNGIFLGTDATSPYSYTWPSVGQGSYSLTAVATDNLNATTTSTPVNVTVTASGGSLPPPWVEQDIGAVGAAGSATYASGTFTVKGAGEDIWSTLDEFHYVYQPLSGDGTIIARVNSIQNTHPWAKVGVMIRETAANNSRHAMMALTPGNGLAFQRRLDWDTANTGGALVAAPYWVKLVRSGSTFTGYSSPTGATWTLVGSATITMSPSTLVGLAVTSHNDPALNTSTFDNISVTSP